MDIHRILSLITFLVLTSDRAYAYICDQAICEYTFEIRRFRTMTYFNGEFAYNVELNGTRLQAAENSYRLKVEDDFIGTEINPDDVITADGYVRNVITINDKFPGPDLHIIAGAQIVVHVTNHMVFETTSIHWHGVHLQDNPWMDGVPYLSQCPILPRQKFTYRFKAYPHGTRMYHSHLGSQRIDGLYGLLIIYPHIPTTPEFVFSVNDWLHDEAVTFEHQNPRAIEKSGTGEMMVALQNRDYILDNNEMTVLQFYGALINGRGRWNDLPYPLTEFKVTEGLRNRFRMASTGVEYSFEVSIDGHQMDIVAVDGGEIQPIRVDSYIIHTGETLDFEVVTDQIPDRYWMRAVTIRHGSGPNPQPDGIIQGVKAIFSYEDASGTGEPTSSGRACTADSPCAVFGCPYGNRPPSHYTKCIGIEEASSITSPLELQDEFGINDPDSDVIEYFYNFAFPIGSSVNARKFIESRAPLFRPDIAKYTVPCDDAACDAHGCFCTYVDKIPFNKTIQLVLINYTPGSDLMAHHIIHLHGHSFAVMKVGYAEHNETTGYWTQPNRDIECSNGRVCTKARWANQRPELNTESPPVKNNIIVPSRGYAVIRFRSNNPGFWAFHCHMEQHIIDGMVMVLNVGPDNHPPIPDDFPDCHDFTWSEHEYYKYEAEMRNKRLGKKSATDSDGEDSDEDNNAEPEIEPEPEPESETVVLSLTTAIGASFGFLLLGGFIPLIAISMYMCCAARRGSHNMK